jgi:hypothetical protein
VYWRESKVQNARWSKVLGLKVEAESNASNYLIAWRSRSEIFEQLLFVTQSLLFLFYNIINNNSCTSMSAFGVLGAFLCVLYFGAQ